MILVTFALREEAREFVSWLERQNVDRRDGINVAYVGIGAEAVQQTLPVILEARQPELLICAGFAGALTDKLKLGEVFLADNRSTFQQTFPHLKKIKLHSARTVLESAAEREKCAGETVAQAVDMESETVCEIARGMNISVLTIRAISDTADAPIPIPFAVSYDLRKQAVRRWAIFCWLISQPHEWLPFFQFFLRVKTARMALCLALVRVLDQLLAEKYPASKVASPCPES